jgi:hypothetical protein
VTGGKHENHSPMMEKKKKKKGLKGSVSVRSSTVNSAGKIKIAFKTKAKKYQSHKFIFAVVGVLTNDTLIYLSQLIQKKMKTLFYLLY